MAGKRPAGASHAGFVPSSERVYGIRVVHRERADLTALTELFVRFTLAETNAKRPEEPAPVVRPETLKPDLHLDSTAQEATITTRPQSSGP